MRKYHFNVYVPVTVPLSDNVRIETEKVIQRLLNSETAALSLALPAQQRSIEVVFVEEFED